MAEQFANNAASTLNGAIDNVTTTIVVTDGSSFPSTGNFRLIIGSNPATAEIVIATARSSNTITVIRGQEGTSADSWPDLTPVTHILTSGAVYTLQQTLRGKTLDVSLETIGAPQDGYALIWSQSDGYWKSGPQGGNYFTKSGTELNTVNSLSIDSSGIYASTKSVKLWIDGYVGTSAQYTVGAEPKQTFKFGYVSDNVQSFVVPAGVTSISIVLWGPGGGSGNYNSSGGGGAGGFASGILSVTPGETLYLVVGSGGKPPAGSSGNGGLGGWPGGGYGTRGDASGGGGGGYTGIFTGSTPSQANALIIAGGGGGSAGYGNYTTGGGGGLVGGSANGFGGKGGTQIAGGLNGLGTSSPSYTAGSALAGGVGFTDRTTSQSVDGGGGGSGYFGGGSGIGDGTAAGGGSGYLHPTRITNGILTAGNNAAAGNTANPPPNTTNPFYVSGVGAGAQPSVGTGGDGYLVLFFGSGQNYFDINGLTFNNEASITTPTNSLVLNTVNAGSITLNSSSGTTLLQSSSESILSSGTSDLSLHSNAVRMKLFSTGAIVMGTPAAVNSTSTNAQAGLTGAVINISPISSGTLASQANQSVIFNNAGVITLHGHSGVRFNHGSGLAGYFDSNRVFRIGTNSDQNVTVLGGTSPANGDSFYSYVSSQFNQGSLISGSTTGRSLFHVLNIGAGGTATVGLSVQAGGTVHSTAEYAGNGILEQYGAATSGLIFTKLLGNNTGFASTGAIWQSGAWAIGRSGTNSSSALAQAGLTGPLVNLSTTTGGTLTSASNQGLLYNASGIITLQGHTGHNFIVGTTSVASTNSSKFITSLGRRTATNVKTANYTVTASDHVIIVGTLSGSITITLPASPTAGDTYIVKDQLGSAAANNIIVSGNGNNIDGAASYTISTNYGSATVIFANGSWSLV